MRTNTGDKVPINPTKKSIIRVASTSKLPNDFFG